MSNLSELRELNKNNEREKIVIKTSVIGIITNVFLAAFKAGIGLLSNSIAIVLDAVNNISDAGSSIITIVGTKLAGKAPDKKHPFGHVKRNDDCGDYSVCWYDVSDRVG